jgi:peptidoglycan/LPS O-acetylase OafA/YrhL
MQIYGQIDRTQRYEAFDGLRGVSALVVVANHALLTFPAAWAISQGLPSAPRTGVFSLVMRTPLFLLFSGQAFVMVFFALSGAVLALTFIDVDRWRYGPYAIKRLARIWLPFAAALVFSAVLFQLTYRGPIPNLSGWVNASSWNKPLTVGAFSNQLFMVGTDIWLDNPIWSLFHELRISLIFPLLLYFLVKTPRVTLMAALIINLGMGYLAHRIHNAFLLSYMDTSTYLIVFCAGATIMVHRAPLRQLALKLSGASLTACWLLGALFLLADSSANPLRHNVPTLVLDLIVMAGAAIVVGLTLCAKAPGLTGKLPRWLGRISYSLYLLHVPIMLAVLHFTNGASPIAALAVAIALAFAASHVSAHTIEKGSQRFGRFLASRLIKPPAQSAFATMSSR